MNEKYTPPMRTCSKCGGHGGTPVDITVQLVHRTLLRIHGLKTVHATAINIHERLPKHDRGKVRIPSVHNALSVLKELGVATSHRRHGVRAHVWRPVEVTDE